LPTGFCASFARSVALISAMAGAADSDASKVSARIIRLEGGRFFINGVMVG
jgi:hypothetical protein